MRRLRSTTILLSLLLLLSGILTAPALAQSSTPGSPTEDPIDVVVLLDDSGSMATCWPWPQDGAPFGPPCRAPSVNQPSDPGELRYSAASLLIHLADAADRIAVVRFDSTAEGIGALGALQPAGGLENRRRLSGSLQPPTSYTTRGYTRIDLGLERAIELLAASREPNRSQYVLLLSDGEPTAPGTVQGQRETISSQLDQLRDAGVFIFPVILCNPTSGCAGDFLSEQFAQERVREAATAADLVRTFSEIFADMKSDRSIVTSRDGNGNLAFTTRESQAVGEIAFVSPRADISSVRRNENPILTLSLLEDENIDLNLVEGDIPAGEWVAASIDLSSFAVVQADSYPELIFPPPSSPNSPASVRYYPTGKGPLVVARGAGPAAGEPLLLDGEIPIPTLGKDESGREALGAVQLSGRPEEITIQLGDDSSPLQLQRTFRLEARPDLPRVEVFSPLPAEPGIGADGRLRMEVGFGPGLPVANLSATAYVLDATEGVGAEQPVYQSELTCQGRTCSDTGFSPEDGRNYRIRFLLSGEAEEIRFGDWAEASIDVDPAVYVRGLPANIDLARVPAEGLPLSVVAGTSEEIGTLEGRLSLRNAESGEPAPEAVLRFSIDVPESGSQDGFLRFEGLDLLRPGQYEGEIELTALNPAGRPMEVKIRPTPTLPVTLTVERSVARLLSQEAAFAEVPFEPSANFRVEESVTVPVSFSSGVPFRITAELTESTCSDLSVVAQEVASVENGFALPLRVQSLSPVLPGACSGTIALRGPSEDFDVLPVELPFRLRIRGIEWSTSGSLNFGDLRNAGEQETETLRVRFDGSTPFVVQVLGIEVQGERGTEIVTLDESSLEAPPVEIVGEPDGNGFYDVPVTLIARKTIPQDSVRGSFYSGDLVLGIEGLPNESRAVDISFRSPTLYQRYVEWWLRPFYTFPLVLCTAPLLLLAVLVVVARGRTRGMDLDEEEPVVTLPQPEFQPEPEVAFARAGSDDEIRSPGESEVTWSNPWGSVEWGGARDAPATADPEVVPWSNGAFGNGLSNGDGGESGEGPDPWRSSW